MQTAATTNHAALTASPRLSATIANETAPSTATPAHKIFGCPRMAAPLGGALFLRSDNELLEMVSHRRQQRHRRRLDRLGGRGLRLHSNGLRARAASAA